MVTDAFEKFKAETGKDPTEEELADFMDKQMNGKDAPASPP